MKPIRLGSRKSHATTVSRLIAPARGLTSGRGPAGAGRGSVGRLACAMSIAPLGDRGDGVAADRVAGLQVEEVQAPGRDDDLDVVTRAHARRLGEARDDR